jgi:hypothetical protein
MRLRAWQPTGEENRKLIAHRLGGHGHGRLPVTIPGRMHRMAHSRRPGSGNAPRVHSKPFRRRILRKRHRGHAHVAPPRRLLPPCGSPKSSLPDEPGAGDIVGRSTPPPQLHHILMAQIAHQPQRLSARVPRDATDLRIGQSALLAENRLDPEANRLVVEGERVLRRQRAREQVGERPREVVARPSPAAMRNQVAAFPQRHQPLGSLALARLEVFRGRPAVQMPSLRDRPQR